ncbi:MAG: glycine--tRNA ligase, partial [Planctomycetaceae bacterium]|nr:glycine--tRNA ligase [Planctomycetaceae bacterium]
MEMKDLVALCKKRGFLFQSSEIYGGLNGFWDYGPLGVELKKNVKNAWWQDMVATHNEQKLDEGAPSKYEMTGLDCTIIMHPQVWKCSGHYDLFHDFMVDCTESKRRYRYDQLRGRWVEAKGQKAFVLGDPNADSWDESIHARAQKFFNLRAKDADQMVFGEELISLEKI